MKSIITKEWGEIGFGSSKRDGWLWEVAFFIDGEEDAIDRHYYSNEELAIKESIMFERGLWFRTETDGVEFEEG